MSDEEREALQRAGASPKAKREELLRSRVAGTRPGPVPEDDGTLAAAVDLCRWWNAYAWHLAVANASLAMCECKERADVRAERGRAEQALLAWRWRRHLRERGIPE